MSNESKILDLIFNGAGRGAPGLTHDLRVVGNGCMSDGIAMVAKFGELKGIRRGMGQGVLLGLGFGTIITATVYFSQKTQVKKAELKADILAYQEERHRLKIKELQQEQQVGESADVSIKAPVNIDEGQTNKEKSPRCMQEN